jgi:YegS/Rv2252/BmrU family lipid kinase
MAGRTLFIVNPISGYSSRRKKFAEITAEISSNPDYHLAETQYPGHAKEIASQAKNDFQTIVAVGGDGTINEIAAGILGSNASLGIIPMGSGNGLANHLSIPQDCTKALKLIENAQPKPLDIIFVNDRIVVNVGGLGFDGHVAKLFNNTENRGLLTYMRLILRELIRFKEFDYGVKADNFSEKGKAFIIAIANGTEFGNNFKIAPEANHNDGKLTLVIIRKPPFYKLIRLFIMGYRGKLKPSKYYQNYLLEKAELSFSNTVVHVDGEIDEKVLTSPLRITVKNSALKVYF